MMTKLEGTSEKKTDGPSILSRLGIVCGAIALIPALLFLSHITDDSVERAQAKAERVAAQDEKNRQIIYDELNRRLGNK